MSRLITTPNIERPDDVYQMLNDLHLGCSDEESRKRNARLLLILINHIGDESIIQDAIAAARDI